MSCGPWPRRRGSAEVILWRFPCLLFPVRLVCIPFGAPINRMITGRGIPVLIYMAISLWICTVGWLMRNPWLVTSGFNYFGNG